jgi:hypothetical protein
MSVISNTEPGAMPGPNSHSIMPIPLQLFFLPARSCARKSWAAASRPAAAWRCRAAARSRGWRLVGPLARRHRRALSRGGSAAMRFPTPLLDSIVGSHGAFAMCGETEAGEIRRDAGNAIRTSMYGGYGGNGVVTGVVPFRTPQGRHSPSQGWHSSATCSCDKSRKPHGQRKTSFYHIFVHRDRFVWPHRSQRAVE